VRQNHETHRINSKFYYGVKETFTKKAYKEAKKVLHECVSSIGLKASALPSGYNEIWGRDSMITSLGALLADDQDLLQACRKSLETLKEYQTELGLIPNNVDVKEKEAEYRAYMDGNLWYVIGVNAFFKKTNDREFLSEYYASVLKTLTWLSYQDVDNTGLLSMQEAADWEDLFPVRGKVLYDNALYYKALISGSELAKAMKDRQAASEYKKKAKEVSTMIHRALWIHDSHDNMSSHLEEVHKAIKNNRRLEEEKIAIAQNCLNLVWRPYFLAFRSFRQYGDWFDTFGNSLTVLFGIANKEETEQILNFAGQVGISHPYPGKAVYPPIFPGEKEWRDYFKIGNLNLPHHYHNGGIWPFVGGFYVAALVKAGRIKEAKKQLEALAKSNFVGKRYEWEFNEWLHGVTGNPMGYEKQAWSAGMYIFAYECVKTETVPFL